MPSSVLNAGTTEKPGMKCPVCLVALVMSERQTIEIDYCPQCRGVWLDRGELDKIIECSFQQYAAPQEQAADYGNAGFQPDSQYRDEYNFRDQDGHPDTRSYGREGEYRSGKHNGGKHSHNKHGGSKHGGRYGNRGGSQLSWLKDLFD